MGEAGERKGKRRRRGRRSGSERRQATKRVPVRVCPAFAETLTGHAAKRGMSRAAFIRHVVAQFFETSAHRVGYGREEYRGVLRKLLDRTARIGSALESMIRASTSGTMPADAEAPGRLLEELQALRAWLREEMER